MKIILLLALAVGCSQITPITQTNQVEFVAPDSAKKPLKVVKREFWQIDGAQDLLRNTSEATISIWIRQKADQNSEQDIIGFSVGGRKGPTSKSRASIRIFPKGRLFGIARAGDREAEQNIMTQPVIQAKKWHHILLTIDFANDEMIFYLDGVKLESRGAVDFKAKKTSDTPSRTVVLGAEDDGSINHFKGTIKDVGVWRRKLTEEEITVLAKKLKPGEKLMIGM